MQHSPTHAQCLLPRRPISPQVYPQEVLVLHTAIIHKLSHISSSAPSTVDTPTPTHTFAIPHFIFLPPRPRIQLPPSFHLSLSTVDTPTQASPTIHKLGFPPSYTPTPLSLPYTPSPQPYTPLPHLTHPHILPPLYTPPLTASISSSSSSTVDTVTLLNLP